MLISPDWSSDTYLFADHSVTTYSMQAMYRLTRRLNVTESTQVGMVPLRGVRRDGPPLRGVPFLWRLRPSRWANELGGLAAAVLRGSFERNLIQLLHHRTIMIASKYREFKSIPYRSRHDFVLNSVVYNNVMQVAGRRTNAFYKFPLANQLKLSIAFGFGDAP
jgi:hypothetical protein